MRLDDTRHWVMQDKEGAHSYEMIIGDPNDSLP